MKSLFAVGALAAGLLLTSPAVAQDGETTQSDQGQPAGVLEHSREWLGGIASDVDRSESARDASAEVLERIDWLAKQMSFPAFHWVAFSLMAAGVVGFALQLVLAKLVVLGRMGFSLKEVLCDVLGLAISLIGLVLTTQAAAENSTFTQSPVDVLSATVVGVLAGVLHYLWGQAAELQALAGRRHLKAGAARPQPKVGSQNQSHNQSRARKSYIP